MLFTARGAALTLSLTTSRYDGILMVRLNVVRLRSAARGAARRVTHCAAHKYNSLLNNERV